MNSRAAASTSAQFFATGISNWTIPTDQTALATINNTDLQTSRGTVSASDAATLSFTMAHEMAAYRITLGSKSIPFTRTYVANSNTDYSDSGNKTVKAAANFNGGGIKPYYKGTGDYYYAFIKPANTSQQFKCASGIANGWANHPVTTASTAKGIMGGATVQSDSTVIFMARAYSYTGSVQTFTAPISTSYVLEVWGAQGGSLDAYEESGNHANGQGAKGGYSKGNKQLSSQNKLYVCVGGQGEKVTQKGLFEIGSSGGYNGGGAGGGTVHQDFVPAAGGGGATHIAITKDRGILKNYVDNKSEILIVAGGGGGANFWHNGTGHGGGLSGEAAYPPGATANTTYAIPGTQTTGYAFGQGQDGIKGHSGLGCEEGTSGGGGGWYGGGAYTEIISKNNDCAGAGGSGYIGGVSNGQTTAGVREGHGYAKITWHPSL